MSILKVIKLSQIVLELWPAQDFSIRGDKYIMEKVRVLLNTTCLYWSLSIPLLNINKIFQNIKKLWHTQELDLEIHSGEVTKKQPQ